MPDTMIQSPISGAAMPVEISKAIAEVMSKVKSLPKNEHNGHSNYDFASIDAFLMAIGPLCAEAGLIILQDEHDLDVIDRSGKAWLKATYSFVLAHASRSIWDRPMKRTVFQIISGPQTAGSVQSYAQKQFLRSMFLVPTGEKDDPDYHPKEDMPSQQPQQARQDSQERPKPAKRPTQPKTAEAIQRPSNESGGPEYTPMPIGASGALYGRWTKMALESLAGKPESWRRDWLELHQIELAEMRTFHPGWCDKVASAAIAPDLREVAE
jgi:hypothetical protein